MTPTTRNAYFVDYPRGFANEYTVYAVASADAPRLAEAFPELEPITRAEAVRLGWTRPREAKKYGEQWYGGFAEPMSGRHDSDTLGRAIEGALVATAQMMGTMERVAEAVGRELDREGL